MYVGSRFSEQGFLERDAGSRLRLKAPPMAA
jgi:hypothetical protein